MVRQEDIWPKKLTVDKRIVRILSGSTYEDFPNTIREIIMNSYDADASNVEININLESEIIEIVDDGRGMGASDFDFYLRIAGKTRSKKEETQGGRKVVGQFGVGFLSIFPFCKKYKIETTKRGDPEVVTAEVPCEKYFSSEERIVDVDQIPIHGSNRVDEKQKSKQFTKVSLVGFTDIAKAYFTEEYELENRRNTVYNYSSIKLLKWKLSEDLPINYGEKKFDRVFGDKEERPFNVYIDGEMLSRNIHARNILETHEGDFHQIGDIKFKYFLATDFKPVSPTEARFIKLRNLNVGVGERKAFGIGTQTRTYSYMYHITGDVDFIEGANNLIAVSRDKFNFHPDLERVKDFLKERLTSNLHNIDLIHNVEREGKQISNVNVVKGIENLEADKILSNIEKLKEIGFTVENRKSTSSSGDVISIDKENKVVKVQDDFKEISRSIKINEEIIHVELDEWSIDDNEFQACRREGKSIVLNRKYPLFSGKKYVDLFIKFNLMLFISYEKKSISKESFLELQQDILNNFKDYL